MNKSMLKVSTILIVLFIFIYGFSASYNVNNIDNIAYVTALGIDSATDDNNLTITFEFIDSSAFTKNDSSSSTTPILDTVTETSINSAINLLNSYVGKEINLSHCKVIIFSEDLARKGINSQVTELMNNIQLRPSTNLIITKSKASEYIKNSSSTLEKVLTKYYDMFPNSSEYTGYTSNITLGKFYNCLVNKYSGNLAILGGLNKLSSNSENSSSNSDSSNSSSSGNSQSNPTGENSESDSSGGSSSSNSNDSNSSSEIKEDLDALKKENDKNVSAKSIVAGKSPIIGERGTENIGLAVFKDDVYINDLTAADTLCHTLINGEVDSFLININNPKYYKHYLDISLFHNISPKITVDTSTDVPEINLEIKLKGRIATVKDNLNFSDSRKQLDLNQVSEAVSRYCEDSLKDYLSKTTNDFQCDIDYFYLYAKRNFLTNEDWDNYDWNNKYLNASFNVSVNANITQSLLNSN